MTVIGWGINNTSGNVVVVSTVIGGIECVLVSTCGSRAECVVVVTILNNGNGVLMIRLG